MKRLSDMQGFIVGEKTTAQVKKLKRKRRRLKQPKVAVIYEDLNFKAEKTHNRNSMPHILTVHL